ncbi:hypothetical protein Q767_10550 [Flavobacterium enshiense DK69]|uniref:Cytochrome P450 n=2 Tax=Flavobacterium TaxID=237 RepID=A0A0A2MTK8_9FLAO|nr:hypothetical protein Q767_10550 [Flavobacterium enshiense DK69]
MREYGDIVNCGSLFFLISEPDIAKQILNRDQKDFNQEDFIGRRIKAVFGNGLVISSGEMWASERKLLNPLFKPQAIHSNMNEVIHEIDKTLDHWEAYVTSNQTFDLVNEMNIMTIMVSGKIFFDIDLKDKQSEVKQMLEIGTKYIVSGPPIYIPSWIPTIQHLKLRWINRKLDKLFKQIVQNRLESKVERNDFADIMINALAGSDASTEDRRLMLDEMKTMLAAGYFPVACTLSIFWHLMGKHPDYLSKITHEIRSKPADYNFTEHFYKDFPLSMQVVFETLRLYPIAFSIWRKSKIEQNIGGLNLSKGKTICISIFNIHRNPNIWDDPDKFYPERFDEETLRTKPKHHFMPFGWGSRSCIGDNLGFMMVYLAIIKIIQKFDVHVLPGQKLEVKESPLLSPKKVYAKINFNNHG